MREASLKSAEVGDGSTSTVVLAQAFCDTIEDDLINFKINIPEYEAGMMDAAEDFYKKFQKNVINVSNEDIYNIATTSANNDTHIGKLIGDAYEKVGRDGVITVDFSKNTETTIEVISGLQFENGYLAPHFITQEAKNQCILENPFIFISDQKVLRTKDIVPILEPLAKNGQSILLLAEEFDNEVLENLKLNKLQGVLSCCAVKAPSFGDYRKQVLEDIAVLTGGTSISYDSGIEVWDATTDMLGKAQKVIVTKDSCTIIGGNGDPSEIEHRIEVIKGLQKELLASPDPSDFMKKFYASRIAKLTGGISVIHVGGVTELAMKEEKDRIDDAVCAVKAAVEEGIVIGGGMSYINVQKLITLSEPNTSRQLGYACVMNNLDAVTKQIIYNAGLESKYSELYNMFTKTKGFNARTFQIEPLLNKGVINAAKCDKSAFMNALSVATMFLKLGCVVANENIDKFVTF